MKKLSFNPPSFVSQTLKWFLNIVFGLFLMGVTFIVLFLLLEVFFTAYYQSEKHTAQTAMNLAIYQNSSYRSWEHKPFAQASHGYGNPTPKISINSLGLRDNEVPEEKTRTRYLLLGDSFTFGMGVDQNKSFPARLQSFLGNKYHKVINAGVIGQTIDDVFMYLKYDGIKLKPDYVVYNFFVGNDVTELRRHTWERNGTTGDADIIRVSDKLLHADEQNRLRHRESKEPDSYFMFWLEEKWNLLMRKYGDSSGESFDPTLTWPVFLSKYHKEQDPNIDRYWSEFEEVLRQMKTFCDKNDIEFIVSIIPMDVQVDVKYWKKYPGMPFDSDAFVAQRPQEHMKQLGEEYNIPVLDFLPIIQLEEKERNVDFYFENDPHFNILGHRFVASYIWEFLMDNYLR